MSQENSTTIRVPSFIHEAIERLCSERKWTKIVAFTEIAQSSSILQDYLPNPLEQNKERIA